MTFLHNERTRWFFTTCALVLLVLIMLHFLRKPDTTDDATRLLKADTLPTSEAIVATPVPSVVELVAVDVIGAVQQPGVYYLAPTARVDDAVKAAGGLAPDGARDQINLAAPVVDGTQIRVPRVGEAVVASPSAASVQANDGLVDINRADAATLDTLPGVGPATASAIIEQRMTNGAFKRVEDIQNVKGIGPSLFAQIKSRITVGP